MIVQYVVYNDNKPRKLRRVNIKKMIQINLYLHYHCLQEQMEFYKKYTTNLKTLYWSAWADKIKQYRLNGLSNRYFLLKDTLLEDITGGQTSKIKVPSDAVSGEDSLPGL